MNHNGHLTFDSPWSSYRPQSFPLYGSRNVIAPLWTDLDNRGNGQVFYNQYTSGSILQQATQDINGYFPGLNFNANWVFVATWYEVAYYSYSGTVSHLVPNERIHMIMYVKYYHIHIIYIYLKNTSWFFSANNGPSSLDLWWPVLIPADELWDNSLNCPPSAGQNHKNYIQWNT